jgi:hypothetical protein
MESLSVCIKAFISILLQRETQVPHKVVTRFLGKLLKIAKILTDECSSDEERLLEKLLANLIQQEPQLNGASGVELLVSVMEVMDFFFSRLVEQLQAESDLFLAEIDELNKIIVDTVCLQ